MPTELFTFPIPFGGEKVESIGSENKNSYYSDFRNLKKDLLVDQLVFDILFDKYLKESELMTRSKYSKYMSQVLGDDIYIYSDAINKTLERGMEQYYNMIKNSQLREQVLIQGVNPDNYIEYYNPKMKENLTKKKPKYIWDYIYYNHNQNFNFEWDYNDIDNRKRRGTITNRQYRRQLTRDGRNYSYKNFFEDLKEYDNFVGKLLPEDNESPKKYFDKLMDYYALESYKRIDFIFKIITVISEKNITEIDKKHFLVKRFTPLVLVPYEDKEELRFAYKYKHYRPLMLVEDAIHKEILDNAINQTFNEDLLSKHQYIRAKAYELFKYHYEYISSDYRDIKDFILNSYNMRQYHETNEIWEMIKNKEWENMSTNLKQQIKVISESFISINNTLFWKSPNREINKDKQ